MNVFPAAAMASFQRKGLQTRILSTEEEEKLRRDQALVSAFKQQKLEKEAQKNWDLFYKRNSTNFFKDRHWTTREFEELRSCREVGWGLLLVRAIFIYDAWKRGPLLHVECGSSREPWVSFLRSCLVFMKQGLSLDLGHTD